MEVGCLVIVTQDFISELEDELSLFSGDVVQILEVVGKLWFRGESNGVEGKFPRSYVRELPLPSTWDPKTHNRLFAALADFSAVQEGDLAFARGELIIGYEDIDENWCQAENSDGFRGAIPTTHVWPINVERLPKEEDSKVNRRARVILSMTAQLDDELDLVKDETVTVVKILDRDWYWGEKDDGKQGRFPKGFVTLLEECQDKTADQPPSFEECVRSESPQKVPVDASKDSAQENSSTYQNITELYGTEGYGGANGIQAYARTKYKFNSQYPNELSFDVGQIVNLIRHIDDEWIEGELNNKTGLFPTEYVDIIVDVPHDLPTITGTLAKALYDFESEVSGDLQLKEGEVVIILEKVSDDWYKARNSRGDVGICPVNYVQVTPSPFHSSTTGGIQPSKRVVNPVISNLPNRSNRRTTTVSRNSINGASSTAASTASIVLSSNLSRQVINKPLPALPIEENNLYSNLDGNICNDNCDTNGQQHPDPRSLIDVRQRVEEYYYALYKLEEVGPGQLPLAQGQVVLVIYTSDLENNPEWWYVEDRYGKQGYVPASYLRKYKTSA